ncbi:DUF4958 domain-containing protein [Flammeovirga kamogawensis]|uniref:DUF4958 domain-containing protein n=1 Tax=Flammeovirga kamogawensis TaxID=373891 RepID=A0ABX8H4B6_9BACT|nr:DUF4958 domain-containing protein [Flammeovirga kamogawensis]MBB6461878.1 hypothetical protein [Flammeovirga kamogawensis]QWG10508.1 DUF4958 domain-containing protein [Flammeovirga kamogawensis]TRX63617.1 DUF4958 domain-containing protein [Flammeovirga kamogawensis]
MKRLFTILIVYGLLLLSGCEPEQQTNVLLPPSNLSYVHVIGAAESGQGFTTPRPAVQTSSTPAFHLVSVKGANGGEYIDGEVTLDSVSGIISLANGHQLIDGDYYASVSVKNNYGDTDFTDVFQFTVLPSIVSGITYTPNEYTIMRGEEELTTEAPTIEGGSSPYTFKSVNNSFFAIDSASGVVSLPQTSALDAGVYNLSVTVTNATNEDVVASNAIKVNYESAPYEITYTNPTPTVPVGHTFIIDAPVTKGTNKFGNTIAYSLVNNYNNLFTINPSTALITFTADPTLVNLNDTFKLDVKAVNAYGEYVKENAVNVTIVEAKDWAPYNLMYDPNYSKVFQGDNFTSVTPIIGGLTDNLIYTLENDFDIFAIDENSGVLSYLPQVDPSAVEPGNYELNIEATNPYGLTLFPDAYSVEIVSSEPEVIFTDGFEDIPADVPEYVESPTECRFGKFVSYSVLGVPSIKSGDQWFQGFDYRSSTPGDNANYPYRPGIFIVNGKQKGEDYLVSDEIDFTYHNNLKLTLIAASKYGTEAANSEIEMYATTNFTGDPTTTTWIQIDIPATKNLSNQSFVTNPIIDFDLNQLAGKKVRLAFKVYTIGDSESSMSRNYWINTIQISGSRFR